MWGEGGRHGEDESGEEDMVFVGPSPELDARLKSAQDEFGRVLDEMKRLVRETAPAGKSPSELRAAEIRYRELKARHDALADEMEDLRAARA